MKYILKNIFIAITLAFTFAVAAQADKDVPITVRELPARAQSMLRTHFKGRKVAFAKKETDLFGKSYDIVFTNGDKIEFDRNGNWTSMNCRRGQVPAALVHPNILHYVRRRFRSVRIVKIEREHHKYEVDLSNGAELRFDKNGRLTKYKD